MREHWVRLGDFQLDLETGDLLGADGPVPIQPLPARVLTLLVSRPGAVVPRDEIKQRIWGEVTFAADQALNAAIRQVRIALDDSATEPRYVATVPRKGYRFVAALRPGEGPRTSMEPAPTSPASGAAPAPRRSLVPTAIVAAVLAVAFVGIGLLSGWRSDGAGGSTIRSAAHLPPEVRLEYLKARELLDESDTTSWRQASEAFEAVRDRHPGFTPATAGAGHAALRLGEHARAAGLASWTLAADSLNGEANMILGTTLLLAGEWHAARAALERARSLAPRLVSIYTGLATLDALDGRLDAAFRQAEEALRIDPMSAITLGDAGYVALWTERPEAALEWCGHALDLRPDWNTPRYCLLDAHHALGRSERELEIAVDLMRRLGAAPAGLREVATSGVTEGLSAYRAWQIHRLDPDGLEPPALAGYLAFLHMQNDDRDAAMRLLRLARESDPVAFRMTLLDPVFEPLREKLDLQLPSVEAMARR